MAGSTNGVVGDGGRAVVVAGGADVIGSELEVVGVNVESGADSTDVIEMDDDRVSDVSCVLEDYKPPSDDKTEIGCVIVDTVFIKAVCGAISAAVETKIGIPGVKAPAVVLVSKGPVVTGSG